MVSRYDEDGACIWIMSNFLKKKKNDKLFIKNMINRNSWETLPCNYRITGVLIQSDICVILGIRYLYHFRIGTSINRLNVLFSARHFQFLNISSASFVCVPGSLITQCNWSEIYLFLSRSLQIFFLKFNKCDLLSLTTYTFLSIFEKRKMKFIQSFFFSLAFWLI